MNLLELLWRRGAVAATLAASVFNAAAQAPAGTDAAMVKRGEYLAIAGDCIACHTAPGGSPMAGGLSLPTPLGPIVSTNITPSKTHGIGNYSQAQFTRALRQGVRADGARLYPAMPYPAYAQVTDDDAQALYAYFMHGVQPVESTPPATRLPFPFNIRLAMAGWNLLYLDSRPFTPDPGRSAEWNRGAYLVNGLTHCVTCHTPRNALMAEDASRALGGGEVGPWHAPNITSDPVSGIGGWSVDELVTYMRLGHAPGKSQAGGPMAEAIDASLRYLSEPDLRAIAGYLKTVPPVRNPADTQPSYSWGAAGDDLHSIRGVAWPQDRNKMTGPQIYDAYCASCHQAQGQGSFEGGLPPLFHNAALGRLNTNNLVMVTLEGVRRDHGTRMPGFAHELTDAQVATLGNYLTQRWGNSKARVTTEQVATLRAGGAATPLLALARGAMVVAALVVLALVAWGVQRRRR